jgi:hypothetical protein
MVVLDHRWFSKLATRIVELKGAGIDEVRRLW